MIAAEMRLRMTVALLAAIMLAFPAVAHGTSVPDAKALGDGAGVTLSAKLVTYASTDFFYIQEPNAGISLSDAPVGGLRVNKTAHGFPIGARLNITGAMRTNEKSERYIDCTSATSTTGTGTVVPWMMNNKTIGGPGSTGLLVRTTGFVDYVDPSGAFAYIDDGSELYDGNTAGPLGAGLTGLRVIMPTPATAPKTTQYVTVTGVSVLETIAGAPAVAILTQAIVRNDPATPISDMNMLCVPGGDYLMGNSGTGDDATYGRPCEYPQHVASVPTFWISKCEVTRGQFSQFTAAGGYSNAAYWSGEGWSWKLSVGRTQPSYWGNPAIWQERGMPQIATLSFTQTDSHPVVGVSYYEAEAFCKWAGGRLPTEAEWEKAARWDGTPRIYPWGDATDKTRCNDWYDTTCMGFQTAPTASYSANASPYGCLGMAGNVWEWTSDWHKSYPGSNSPFDKSGIARTLRGGGWYGIYGDRCASRWFASPSSTSNDIGFRLAR